MPAPSDIPPPVHVRSDPLFYLIMATIGGTYVVLIIVMLLADATYIFSSDLSREVIVDFSTGGDGKTLQVGDQLTDQFASYGLSIATHDSKHPARILDSDKPSASNSTLGTPHHDFGGPGVGSGGRRDTEGQNDMPMGRVVVIAANADPIDSTKVGGEVVFNWVRPVRIEHVDFSGLRVPGGEVVTYGQDGAVVGRHAIPDTGSVSQLPIGDEGIVRLDAMLASDVGSLSVSVSSAGEVNAKLGQPSRERLQLGSTRVVPKGAGQIVPSEESGKLILNWQDPVRLDELEVLDIDASGGVAIAFDLEGNELQRRPLLDLGPNSRQTVEFGDLGTDDVARLELSLPSGGALAELQFTWTGRLRAAWERDHPRLARLIYNPLTTSLQNREIQYSIRLTLISCTITAILSLWVAIPIGYLLSRHQFFGRNFIDAVLDIPIVLPPLVVGLSLLILFQFFPAAIRDRVVYQVPAVILAQFAVACAFAVRTMRATFDQIDARREQVALTLGCNRAQAFGMVVLPEAKRGLLTAATLAWARSLGEFGPLLIFAGTTRMRTEVLSTTVFLELNVGNLGAAVAVSLIMVAAAVVVLLLARAWGTRSLAI